MDRHVATNSGSTFASRARFCGAETEHQWPMPGGALIADRCGKQAAIPEGGVVRQGCRVFSRFRPLSRPTRAPDAARVDGTHPPSARHIHPHPRPAASLPPSLPPGLPSLLQVLCLLLPLPLPSGPRLLQSCPLPPPALGCLCWLCCSDDLVSLARHVSSDFPRHLSSSQHHLHPPPTAQARRQSPVATSTPPPPVSGSPSHVLAISAQLAFPVDTPQKS